MFAASVPESPLPTDEEFNLFHSIDRDLYNRLVIDLGRDIEESMNVVAFWMWLERQRTGGMTLVKRILSLPSHMINSIADESVVCLKCAEKDHFSHPESANELNFLPDMVGLNFPLKFFYDQRSVVLPGVTTICSQVCARAFRDIKKNALDAVTRRHRLQSGLVRSDNFMGRDLSFGRVDQLEGSSMVGKAFSFGGGVDQGGSSSTIAQALSLPGVYQPSQAMLGRAFSIGGAGVDQAAGSSSMVGTGSVRPMRYTPEELGFYRSLEGQRMEQNPAVQDDKLLEIFRNLKLDEEENGVSPEDRTIFLTFSKGYPISEAEVWNFFTGIFGDFIEEIRMQSVAPGEQALFARVVARSRMAAVIDAVVRGGKAKYNINGKHVCARKFVKRNLSSTSSSSAVSSEQSRSIMVPPDARR